jgi:hypothetical protein
MITTCELKIIWLTWESQLKFQILCKTLTTLGNFSFGLEFYQGIFSRSRKYELDRSKPIPVKNGTTGCDGQLMN